MLFTINECKGRSHVKPLMDGAPQGRLPLCRYGVKLSKLFRNVWHIQGIAHVYGLQGLGLQELLNPPVSKCSKHLIQEACEEWSCESDTQERQSL